MSNNPISTYQMPDDVLTKTDLFGPVFWELNDTLIEIEGSGRTQFRTSFVHILGKGLFYVGDKKLSQSAYTELPDGVTIVLNQAAPGDQEVTGLYMKPGTLEYLGWVTNEPPKEDELPDGVRVEFHTGGPVSSVDMLLIHYDGLPLHSNEVSLPDGPGTTRLLFSFAPDEAADLDWTYTLNL